ncbi:MAG: hypothetical protein V2I26_08680, partial [Halieaceae bacterium]|nr:hypothetical protein [Halieaceae bacterium]
MFDQALRFFAVIWFGGILAGVCISGCDGSGSSSSGQEPETPAAPLDLLVYEQDISSRLYKLDSLGRSTLLSEGMLKSDYAISPDGRYIAFADSLADGQAAITILSPTENNPEQAGSDYPPEAYLSIQWQPDSQGVVYSVYDASEFVSYLYLSTLGETEPVELIGSNLGALARLQVEQSYDGSRLAVLVEYYSAESDSLPESAALYLLELLNPETMSLIGTAEGDANSFKFAWSPYGNDLVYQRRLRTDPVAPSIPDNYPAGALMLMDASGTSRLIREAQGDTDWTYLAWLDPTRLLIRTTDLEVINIAGNLLTSHTITGNSEMEISPDHRRLAFLDKSATDGHPAVYMLELESGEYRELGPASSDFLIGGAFEDSKVRWSPHGSYLAWNVKPSPFGPDWQTMVGGLYVYDVGSTTTQLVSENLALHDQHYLSDGFFAWLPEGRSLDYVVRREAGYELAVVDIASGDTRAVGELPSVNCGVQRVWRDQAQILWNACDDGVYLSSSKQSGSFTTSRVADWDVWRMVTTADREFVIMQAVD